MKKLYRPLYYIFAFFCFPAIIWCITNLEHRQIIYLDIIHLIIILLVFSAVIGFFSPHKAPVDWPLAILLPISLAVAYFISGLTDDVYGKEFHYFDINYSLAVTIRQPYWLYAVATLPALLTSFFSRSMKFK